MTEADATYSSACGCMFPADEESEKSHCRRSVALLMPKDRMRLVGFREGPEFLTVQFDV